ncbi:MAG: TonB-dependent receptor [Pyrinomonadaceae bacterium MAG19_C2-C3]|nr:TonB-dependent receptor [Pyrinomonadaceae bacterium MAG19_C2-C3]
MRKFFSHAFAVMLIALCICANAFAQSTVDGAIGGVVRDAAGAVIPNANVSVRNDGTNEEKTATTDDEGRFRIVQLRPGTYTATVNSGNFAPFTQTTVVEVGRVTTIDAELSVGGTPAETVNVTAEAPVINTVQQDFSTNINQTSINELPINGRRASDFVRLTPGVVPDGAFGLNSFRGISGLLNNNTVDGGDNNNAYFSEERGRTRVPYSISQSAVREFQVNTSNYSAEYGRAAGGVVNTVTKSGSNEFHGDAFYYIRDNELGARNAFGFQTIRNSSGNLERIALKPTNRRQQFGGTIGGPIVSDRLFFFFSYDQQKQNFPSIAAPSDASFLNAITVVAPTGNQQNGQPRTCTAPGATTPLSSSETLFCRNITQAQTNTGIEFIRSLTGEVPRTRDQTLFLPKIDWVINSSNTFSAVFNRLRAEAPAGVQSQAVVNRGIASFGDDFVEVDSLNLRLNSTITPTVLNEFRFQYGRDNEFQTSQENSAAEAALLARPGAVANPFGRLPSISTGTGGLTFGQPNFLDRAALPDERRIQFADSMTITKGNQTIKFGVDFNRVRDRIDNLFRGGGEYSYSTFVDFLSDFANPAGRRYNNYQQAFGPSGAEFTTNDYNFFFQDDVRVDPRLTLNFGLRYEYQQLPEVQRANPLFAQTSQMPSDKNNFGPRFGFAYDVTGDGKTSVRGGFGLYYGRIINATIFNVLTGSGSADSQRTFFFRPTDPGAPIFPNAIATAPTATTATPNIVVFDPSFQNPQIYQGDFILERQIGRNTIVSASYLLSVGRNLPTFIDINLPNSIENPVPFRVVGGDFDGQQFTFPIFAGSRPNRDFGAITQVQSDVDSQYDALVLQFNRRLTGGLQFQTNYTLAKATDSGQVSTTNVFTNGPLNQLDRNLEKGTSNFDIRHRFVASAVYTPNNLFGLGESVVGRAIFNGFTIAPIVQISSGAPYSAGISGTAATINGLRPISSGIFGAGGSNRAPFIERNAFRFPATAVVDLRVSRRFNLGETRNIEVLAEGFNIFNRQNITGLGTTAFNASSSSNTLTFQPATFGVPNEAGNTIFSERQIQLAVRFQF